MTNELATTNQNALAPVRYQADQNPALVYLASLSAGSRRTMTQALNAIADMVMPGSDLTTFPWHMLRFQHTKAIRSKLAEQYSASTANKMLAALRKTLKQSRRLHQISSDDYADAVDIDPVRGSGAKQAETGRHLGAGELAALLRACDDGTKAGTRDAAIITVGYICGLRRSELVALTVADVDLDKQTLTIRHGKGNKHRVVPLANGALYAVGDWLHIRGTWAGPLFIRIRRGDHLEHEGLTDQTILRVLDKRAEEAGVKKFSPHDLRRTFAGDLLDAGADIVIVQKLMGHSSVTTTAGYDRRDAQAKKAAVNKLHVPYRRKF
jgi:integrase